LRGAEQLSVPTTPRQRVSATPAGLELVVCDDCGVGETPSEEVLSRALVSNYWLPAAQPEFSALIGRLFLEDDDLSATIKMKRITRFVERHMDEEADYAGYATALEALKSQRGDCTEHALLLAALARAAGIPSRVVIGVAYNNERFLGRRYVFVPHAWVQAWTGERWQSFDSALGEVHSGYIALGVSDGEQEVLLNIHQQLHKLEVMSAVLLKSRR
ncbi:MAG: transglutaminase-like domain-containing protein, partial [Spongiibacteraceae bacterium]